MQVLEYLGTLSKDNKSLTIKVDNNVSFESAMVKLCFSISNTLAFSQFYFSVTDITVKDAETQKQTVLPRAQLDAYLHMSPEKHQSDGYNGETYMVLPYFILLKNKKHIVSINFNTAVDIKMPILTVMKTIGPAIHPIKFSDLKEYTFNSESYLKEEAKKLNKKSINDLPTASLTLYSDIVLTDLLKSTKKQWLHDILFFPKDFTNSMSYQVGRARLFVNGLEIGSYSTFMLSHLNKRAFLFNVPQKAIEVQNKFNTEKSSTTTKRLVPIPLYNIPFNNWTLDADNNQNKSALEIAPIKSIVLKLEVIYIHDPSRKIESFTADALKLQYFLVTS